MAAHFSSGSGKLAQTVVLKIERTGEFYVFAKLGPESRQTCSPGPAAHRFLKGRMASLEAPFAQEAKQVQFMLDEQRKQRWNYDAPRP
jgi:hypothetical protein